MTSRSVLLSIAMTLAIVLSFSACGLQTGGLPGATGGGGGGTPLTCANDAQCDDGNPCTTESCDVPSGVCLRPQAQADGPLPVALQTAGDCKTLSCKAGEPVSDDDDHDFLPDDNDCTVDQCSGGKALHVAEADGSSCLINQANGSCKSGECIVECGTGKPPCDDKEPCTTDACDGELGKCTFLPLPEGAGTPGSKEAPNNCKVDLCVGGKAQIVTDDSDTPSASNDCQQGTCVAGVPMPMFFAKNTTCASSGGQFCDGAGNCVKCNDNAQCGTNDDCNTFTCDAHVCNVAFTAVNTAIAAQVDFDCKKIVCDGAGGTKILVNDVDLPDDKNDCTNDLCTAGVPSHTNLPFGAMCGNNSACNLIGQCGCTDNTQCLAPQTCGGGNPGTPNVCGCTKATCGTLGKSCGTFPDGCGGTINCDDATKNGGETDVDCGGASCSQKCAQGKLCTVNSDCSGGSCADGRCCDSACNGACQVCNLPGSLGVCSSITSGTDNSPVNACSGSNACDPTGACKKINGQGCAVNADCVSGSCADNVCCNVSCTGTCLACNLAGSMGTCSNITLGATDNNATVQCNGTNSCDGTGVCKANDGQNCAVGSACVHGNCVDGVCCNSGCGTTCQACNVMGSVGTCTNLPSGQTDNSPANACNGNSACNGGSGAGACKKILAQPCAVGTDCVSGSCADNVCCSSACNAACRACNVMGSVGTCTNLTSGTDNSPANICVAPNSCDAAGNCKKVNGTACVVNADCVSGSCVDNFCCGSASCPTCQACTGAAGTCVNLALNAQDNVPANTCNGANVCDGAGACKSKVGQGCLMSNTCASGNCADFVCCDQPCSGTCQACIFAKKGAGADGFCGNVAVNTDPDTDCPGTTCNGSGACVPKKANGVACMAGIECVSGNCIDNFCCGSASCPTCKACTGAAGTCVNLALNASDNVPANACTGNSACDGAGTCKSKLGQGCVQGSTCLSSNCVDLVCCDGLCSGVCQACTAVKKGGGADGFCGNVLVNTDPDTDCAGSSCNGAGACLPKLPTGTMCMNDNQCVSGFCTDGVCCVNACAGTCKTCNLPGNPGACLNVPLDQTDDAPACGGSADPTHLCDGSAACLLITGETCMMPLDCVHHNCAANVCAP